MSVSLLLASALLAQPVAPAAGFDSIDVAYHDMVAGRTDAAITRLQASDDLTPNDPATLINLGTAYARKGMREEARACFEAAAAGPRYDLQLADGRWMDSREAARLAARPLAATTLTMR